MRSMIGSVAAALLSVALPAAVALAQICEPVQKCGDVDDSGVVNATDALSVLKAAVGIPQDLVCECGGTTPSVPLKTGQTVCYDADGAEMSCSQTGQDGELRNGTPRHFTDNDDGTVTDHATGLMWEKLARDGSIHDRDSGYTWAQAFDKVAQLNLASFAGHDDWRLPNVRELESLANYGSFGPAVDPVFDDNCIAGCTIHTCSCTNSGFHWSSSSDEGLPTSAWLVYFVNGSTGVIGKNAQLRVRAVRDGG